MTGTKIAVAASILLVSTAATQAAPRHPTNRLVPAVLDHGDVIAFCSDRDGAFEIDATDADGNGPRRLTHDPAEDVGPTWSSDGSRITYCSGRSGNGNVRLLAGDVSRSRRLTYGEGLDASPAWRPRPMNRNAPATNPHQ